MGESCHEEFGWIRHAKDGGRWWPGVYSSTHDEGSLLVEVVRAFSTPRDHPRSDSPVPKFEFSAGKGEVHLYCLPHNGRVVEATQCRSYKEIPTTQGADKCYEEAAKVKMDKIIQQRAAGQDLNATAPLTPSSPLESAYSTATGEAPSDVASYVFCPSSGGGTSPESPALSVSSTVTEIETSVTPLEPSAGLGVHAQASSIPAAGGNGSERKQGGEESETAYQMSTAVICSAQPGAKRSWAQTSHVQQEQQQQRPRPNTTFSTSQFPRLGGPPAPPGLFFCRTEGSKQDLGEAGMETGRYDAHGGLFDGVAISAEGSCGRYHQESSEESEAVDNVRAGGPKRASVQTLPAQQGMDVCEMEFAADAVASTDRDAPTRPAGDAPTPVVVALPVRSDQQRSEHVPVTTSLPADDDAKEAATFLEAGISRKEQFKSMCPKLRKLGWKWGGKVSVLSNDSWFMKPGMIAKTAQAGVGKFETTDDVVHYVRNILGGRGVTTPDGKGIEVAEETDSDSVDEQDSDSVGEESRVEEEQGTPEPTEGTPLTREEQETDSDSVDEQDSDSVGETSRVEEEQGTPEPTEGTPLTREEQALQTALEALHPSRAPGVMKQRATEFKQVLEFIIGSATDPSGGSLYLCGCPGTGKTQTMAHVRAEVRRVAAEGAFPTPDFHAFTGTAFTDPNAMHSALWRAVTGGMDVPPNIEKALSAKLKRHRKTTCSSPMIVVVLDEIDQLMTQNRQVLRKLFEWADAPKSRLVLVGIANSIEFDVGFSKLNTPPEKVLFQAYTPEDLMSILTERVGAVVQRPAVQLCSKKIAATHGDARRAISLCREAVVLAKRELQDKLDNAVLQQEQESVGQQEAVALVTIRHMSVALSAGRVSRYADAIAALSIQAQIVLSVAAAAVYGVSGHRGDQTPGAKAGKCARLTQGDLHEKCMNVWGRLRTGGGLSQIEFSGTIDMLAAQGLLRLKGKQLSGGRARQLVLLIEFSDVEIALGGHPFFKAAVSI